MKTIITILLPVFGYILLGYGLGVVHVLKTGLLKLLNHYIYYVGLSVVVVTSVSALSWSGSSLGYVAWSCGLFLGFAAVTFGLLQLWPAPGKRKAELYLVMTLGNTVYMGAPILRGAVPGFETAAITAAVLMLVLALICGIAALEYWVKRARRPEVYVQRLGHSPLVWSVVAGVVLSFVWPHSAWPSWLVTPLFWVAVTTSPLAMIVLGAFLSGKWRRLSFGWLGVATFVKLVAQPLAAYGLFVALGQPPVAVLAATLSFGLPVAVTAFTLADSYGLDDGFIAVCMLITTTLSLGSLGLILGLVR